MKKEFAVFALIFIVVMITIAVTIPNVKINENITGTIVDKYNNDITRGAYHLKVNNSNTNSKKKIVDIEVNRGEYQIYEIGDKIEIQYNKFSNKAVNITKAQ